MFIKIKFMLVVILMIFALVNDFRTKKIKNIIPLIGITMGVIITLITNPFDLLYSFILSFVYFFALFFIPRIFNIENFLGAGDIKLYIAISFIYGWSFSLNTFLYSIGVGFAILLILNIKRIKEILSNVLMFFVFKGKWKFEKAQKKVNIFTPYIFIGCILAHFINYNLFTKLL